MPIEKYTKKLFDLLNKCKVKITKGNYFAVLSF